MTVRFVASEEDGGTVTEVAADPGSNLLDLAHSFGVPVATLCGGNLACRCCRVALLEGAEVSAPTSREREALEEVGAAPDERFACQTTVEGDVVVLIPPLDEMLS